VERGVPLNVADVEAGAAVDAGPAAHQLLEQDVVAQRDVEHSVDGEDLEVGVELPLCPGEAVQDHSLGGFGLLHLLLDDLRHDVVGNQSTRLHDAADVLDEVLVEAARHRALEDLADLIPGRDVVVAEVLPQQLGVGALADARSAEEEEELLLARGEGVQQLRGQSHHSVYLIGISYSPPRTKVAFTWRGR
jgi:hypothetical protein